MKVDVWLLNKQALQAFSYPWHTCLPAEKSQRAQRIRFPEQQAEFVFYHACTRLILSQYLKEIPQNIVIETDVHGKPFLPNHDVRFNLSHTKGMGIIAVAQGFEIGIDIEKIKPLQNYVDLVKRFFHMSEYQYLHQISTEKERQKMFFHLWTVKEALFKATGQNLVAHLQRSVIPFGSEQSNAYAIPEQNAFALSLQVPKHYVATLVSQHACIPVYRSFKKVLLKSLQGN